MTLPNRRENRHISIHHNNRRLHITVGFYPDGRPGEIFAYGYQSGSQAQAEIDQQCRQWSKQMQQGANLSDFLPYITRDHAGIPLTVSGAALDGAMELLGG